MVHKQVLGATKVPRSLANLYQRKAAFAVTLPPSSPTYRNFTLFTYTTTWDSLYTLAIQHNYIQQGARKARGFSNMLDDIATNNIPLIDQRPQRLLNPPYQDHFLGSGMLVKVKLAPLPATIQYLANFAHDHHILPKRNHSYLTAHAGIVIHLIGLHYITPSHWPTDTRRHSNIGGNNNLNSNYQHTSRPIEEYSRAAAIGLLHRVPF